MKIKTPFLIAAGGLCIAATSAHAQYFGGYSPRPMGSPMLFQPPGVSGFGAGGGGYSPQSCGMSGPYSMMNRYSPFRQTQPAYRQPYIRR